MDYTAKIENATYAGAIVNIIEKYQDAQFVAVPYYKVAREGIESISFGDVADDGARSLADVATALLADRADTESEGYANLIEADGNYSPYTAEQLALVKKIYLAE